MTRILVIEDSSAIALLLRRRLEMAGHGVQVATGGRQALEELECPGPPDLVLSDVTMPDVDGLEILEKIKAGHPELPVILVTGQQLGKAERSKADAVITKPIDFDALLGKVEALTRPPE